MIPQPIIHPASKTLSCIKHGDYESINLLGNIWSQCPICVEVQDAEKAAAEAADKAAARLRQWQNKIKGSGIPDRFHDRTLDSYRAESEGQVAALKFALDYATSFDDVLSTGRSAVFVGAPGTGKTHLAVGIGLHVMREHRGTVLFTTVMRAVRRVKETFRRDSEETEAQAVRSFVEPDLLILDEVGVQFGSDFERNILFDIFNERYEKRRPSLFLSNLTVREAALYLGERVVDRIREDGGQFVPFKWESFRRRTV